MGRLASYYASQQAADRQRWHVLQQPVAACHDAGPHDSPLLPLLVPEAESSEALAGAAWTAELDDDIKEQVHIVMLDLAGAPSVMTEPGFLPGIWSPYTYCRGSFHTLGVLKQDYTQSINLASLLGTTTVPG